MKRCKIQSARRGIALRLFLMLTASSPLQAADFPQGLMLHFSFDQWEGGGVITDKTGRNNNGRTSGAKWTALGKQLGGYDFTSTNNYIQISNSPSLNSTQATFAAWFKTGKPDAISRYIFEKSPGTGYAMCIAGDLKDSKNRGKLCFSIQGTECLSDNAVTDNLWHHGAATFDGEHLKLYVDGQLQRQVTLWTGAIAANTNELTLGLNRSTPTPAEKGLSFEGTLDEVMIFNHALTEPEVKLVITSTKPKFTKDQVAKRLTELKELLDRGLILQEFYDRKVKECEDTP